MKNKIGLALFLILMGGLVALLLKPYKESSPITKIQTPTKFAKKHTLTFDELAWQIRTQSWPTDELIIDDPFQANDKAIDYEESGAILHDKKINAKNGSGLSAIVISGGKRMEFNHFTTGYSVTYLCDTWSPDFHIFNSFFTFKKYEEGNNPAFTLCLPMCDINTVIKDKDFVYVKLIDGQILTFDEIIPNYPVMYADEIRCPHLLGTANIQGKDQAIAISMNSLEMIEMTSSNEAITKFRQRLKKGYETNKLNKLPKCTVTLLNNKKFEYNGAYISDGYGYWGDFAHDNIGLTKYLLWDARINTLENDFKSTQIDVSKIKKIAFLQVAGYDNCPIITVTTKAGAKHDYTLPLQSESHNGVMSYYGPDSDDNLVCLDKIGATIWQLKDIKEIEFE